MRNLGGSRAREGRALAAGTAGVAMGTRFLLTSDSPVAEEVKRLYLAADLDGTVVTSRVDGVPHRVRWWTGVLISGSSHPARSPA